MKAPSPWLIAATLTAAALGGVTFVHFDWLESAEISRAAVEPESSGDSASPITALPTSIVVDERKRALGERLFHEVRLSADGTVACSSCHNLAEGGVDHLPRSLGVGGKTGGINAPTVFNSGFNFRQFWDGRAESLEDQVNGPLLHPLEMAATWPKAVATLSEDPTYQAEFAQAYPDGVTPQTIRNAIATFERSLVTPNSRFDLFLRGNQTALNEVELSGYRLFKQIGCTSCHQGVNIGGNMYQKLGVMEDYFAQRGNLTEADLGRYNITKREEDRFFFKVPSLRNVAVTDPYLHDASASTLDEVIRIMARYQLGKTLSEQEVSNIAAFLRTLTGEYQGKPLQ
jgi:cytochrome c peroxidase